jgi:hypothetical protein
MRKGTIAIKSGSIPQHSLQDCHGITCPDCTFTSPLQTIDTINSRLMIHGNLLVHEEK